MKIDGLTITVTSDYGYQDIAQAKHKIRDILTRDEDCLELPSEYVEMENDLDYTRLKLRNLKQEIQDLERFIYMGAVGKMSETGYKKLITGIYTRVKKITKE